MNFPSHDSKMVESILVSERATLLTWPRYRVQGWPESLDLCGCLGQWSTSQWYRIRMLPRALLLRIRACREVYGHIRPVLVSRSCDRAFPTRL